MPSRRGGTVAVSLSGKGMRVRSARWRSPVFALLLLTVIIPLILLAGRVVKMNATLKSLETEDNVLADRLNDYKRLRALERVESMFPNEVLKVIYTKEEETGSMNLNFNERKDLVSELLQRENSVGQDLPVKSTVLDQGETGALEQGMEDIKVSALDVLPEDVETSETREKSHGTSSLGESVGEKSTEGKKLEDEALERSREVNVGTDGKFSIWKREDLDNPDSLVRLIRDQLIMARAYAAVADSSSNARLARELRIKIKEILKLLGEASVDSELPSGIRDKVKQMGRLLTKAREQHRDCAMMVKKLRAMMQTSEEHARNLKKQSTFLSQLAAKTIPKGLHCLSMLLTVAYHLRGPGERNFPSSPNLEDPTLFHYAVFSDNVLAAAVVVNSTVVHAKDAEKHVFHVVTDRMNFGAMTEWFLENPPGQATIEVQSVDDYKWLNASYCPVLHQLTSSSMKDYYFKADTSTTLATASANLKYRNPKYLSMLNHLRFYLPEVYPKLHKVLFLDDDIVVQKDLSGLWDVDLHGNVNGAVETCGPSFHRFDKYLNFSHPDIAENFDPMACGWAFGMNMFDLVEWKKQDITGIYHKWQRKNEDRLLWKLGTLPPGLITFYNLTYPLDKSWHVLGLGYNPGVLRSELDPAAVIHYNGNMKPWLEIGMSRYKPYWTKYVKYDHPFLQQCNIND